MKLTDYERLTLAAQYRILERIDPGQGWLNFVEIVEGGYEAEYNAMTDLLHTPLPADKCNFVMRALALYDALQRPYSDARQEIPAERIFPGFDGNNEVSYLGYLRFLRGQERFTHVKLMLDDGNSHFPAAGGYKKMLAAWRSIGEPHTLDGEKAEIVLAARNS
jgi:uncharacterized protein YfbU (UPF0304 family)